MVLTKVSGAGNDFLILDLRAQSQPIADRADLARRVCDRTQGVGADGLVILEPSSAANFRWDFYNSDGSKAEMCGNAARCVVQVALWLDPKMAPPVRFETAAGIIQGQKAAHEQIEVVMPAVKDTRWGQSQNGIAYDFVNSGVPHAVVSISGAPQEFREQARALRHHPHFPNGTNVTFLKWTGPQEIHAQSYERGVEDFTLACGTGAVAAAMVAFHQRPELKNVDVVMPGGTLNVTNEAQPRLTGPARIIAKIDWLG